MESGRCSGLTAGGTHCIGFCRIPGAVLISCASLSSLGILYLTRTNPVPPGWVQFSAMRMLWAVETGGSGPCPLASSFGDGARSARSRQWVPESRTLFPPAGPLCKGTAAESGFSALLLCRARPSLWGGHFLCSLSTPWCPSDDPRPTWNALWAGLVTVQNERAGILHAHLFPSALLGERPARGLWKGFYLISFAFIFKSPKQWHGLPCFCMSLRKRI